VPGSWSPDSAIRPPTPKSRLRHSRGSRNPRFAEFRQPATEHYGEIGLRLRNGGDTCRDYTPLSGSSNPRFAFAADSEPAAVSWHRIAALIQHGRGSSILRHSAPHCARYCYDDFRRRGCPEATGSPGHRQFLTTHRQVHASHRPARADIERSKRNVFAACCFSAKRLMVTRNERARLSPLLSRTGRPCPVTARPRGRTPMGRHNEQMTD